MKIAELVSEWVQSPDDETVTITFTAKGDAKIAVTRMLPLMASLGSMGCSRELGVLDDKGFKSIGFDGDGPDKIFDLKVNGSKVPSFYKPDNE